MITDYWNDNNKKGERFSNILKRKNQDALTPRKIAEAQKTLEIPITRLQAIDEKLRIKEEQIFERIIAAQRARNNRYAEMYANELSHVRKMKSMVTTAKLSMEQVKIRLNTVSELGDIVVTLSPCMSIIRDLGPTISGMIPEASNAMNDLSEIMGDMMSQSRITSEDLLAPNMPRNREAMDILDEAHTVLTREAEATIPAVPQDLLAESNIVSAQIQQREPPKRQSELA